MEPDINQPILAELKQLRRITKGWFITSSLLFTLLIGAAFWVPRREGAYADTNTAFRALDYRRAAFLAEKLVADHPQDYSLHSYLGSIYLRSGDLSRAEEAYTRSHALYPSEDTGKILATIRKARSEQTSSVNPSASDTPSAHPTR